MFLPAAPAIGDSRVSPTGARADQRLPGELTALMVTTAKGQVEEAKALLAAATTPNFDKCMGWRIRR